jgi:hypothetical protein
LIGKSRREPKGVNSLPVYKNFKRLLMIITILLSAGQLKANEILREVKGFSPEMTHDEFGQRAAELGVKVIIASADERDTRSIAELNGQSNFSLGGAKVSRIYLIERYTPETREILVETNVYPVVPNKQLLAESIDARMGEPSRQVKNVLCQCMQDVWDHLDGGGYSMLDRQGGTLTILRRGIAKQTAQPDDF